MVRNARQASVVRTSTNLEVLQDTHDLSVMSDPLVLVFLGDVQRTREGVMDEIGVEGCGDLVKVIFNETFGPCHYGLNWRALLGSSRHGVVEDGWREGRRGLKA